MKKKSYKNAEKKTEQYQGRQDRGRRRGLRQGGGEGRWRQGKKRKKTKKQRGTEGNRAEDTEDVEGKVEEVDGDKHAEDDQTRDHYQQPITEKQNRKKKKKKFRDKNAEDDQIPQLART